MQTTEPTSAVQFASRLALTGGTDLILRPMQAIDASLRQITAVDYCDVMLASDKRFNLYFYRLSPSGAQHMPSHVVERDFINRFPEHKPLEHPGIGTYISVPATDTSALILSEAWPKGQLKFHDAETRGFVEYLYMRVFAQTRTLQAVARWREGQPMDCPHEQRDDKPLLGFQQVALSCTIGAEGYGLFMEQGTGKTCTAIARICNEARLLRQAGNTRLYSALIVCPKGVCSNWASEIAAFTTRRGRVEILRGQRLDRLKALADAFRVDPETDEHEDEYAAVIVSYDILSRDIGLLTTLQWDLAIWDESQYCKSVKTDRFKNSLKLRDCARQRMLLTGTPIGNSALDLYAQLELMGEGWSGFSDFKSFCKFYGVFAKDANAQGNGVQKLIGLQNMPFIKERLARCAFIIRKSEALPDLPKKQYDIVDVELSPEQAEVYGQLQDSLMVQIQDELDSDIPKTLLVNSILTRLLRLAEVTSGYVRYDEVCNPHDGTVLRPKIIDRFDPNPKLDALIELVKDKTPEQKTIVWACFTENIKMIRARLELEGLDCVTFYGKTTTQERDNEVHRFNCDPTCRFFVGNPSAGGIGLNLIGFDKDDSTSQSNCDHVIYYSQNWSALVRSQSEDRAHRPQTRVPVRYTDLCVPNSVDEEIRARVLNKLRHALEVSDVREILAKVLHAKLR